MSTDELKNAANRRGRAYRCRHCTRQGRPDFVAEKFRVESHVYKHHVPLDRVPFSCKTCMFRSTTLAQFEKHLKSYSWHRQRGGSPTDGTDSLCESTDPYSVGSDDWEMLSKESSLDFFLNRSRQNSSPTGQSPASADVLHQAMVASGLDETPPQEVVELTIYAEVDGRGDNGDNVALDLSGGLQTEDRQDEEPLDLRVVCVKARKESVVDGKAGNTEEVAAEVESREGGTDESEGAVDFTVSREVSETEAAVAAISDSARTEVEEEAEAGGEVDENIFPGLIGMGEEKRIASTPIRARSPSVSSSSSSGSSSSASSVTSQQEKLVEALAGLVKQSSDMVQYSVDRTMEMMDRLRETIEGQREELRRFTRVMEATGRMSGKIGETGCQGKANTEDEEEERERQRRKDDEERKERQRREEEKERQQRKDDEEKERQRRKDDEERKERQRRKDDEERKERQRREEEKERQRRKDDEERKERQRREEEKERQRRKDDEEKERQRRKDDEERKERQRRKDDEERKERQRRRDEEEKERQRRKDEEERKERQRRRDEEEERERQRKRREDEEERERRRKRDEEEDLRDRQRRREHEENRERQQGRDRHSRDRRRENVTGRRGERQRRSSQEDRGDQRREERDRSGSSSGERWNRYKNERR